eukprot:scaffold387190_cov21-Prasinocladus_malaysianus.AAC.1
MLDSAESGTERQGTLITYRQRMLQACLDEELRDTSTAILCGSQGGDVLQGPAGVSRHEKSEFARLVARARKLYGHA